MDLKEEIQSVSTTATQEEALSELLDKVIASWDAQEFVVNNFKEQRDVFILGGIDEVQQNLDDSMVTISTISASRFVSGIKSQVQVMESKLLLFGETMDQALSVQRNWMYLEPIFSSPDIQRQLPLEAKLFLDVDKQFKILMRGAAENPKALKLC